MSVTEPGFQSSAVFETINSALGGMSESERSQLMKQASGVYEFQLKSSGKVSTWTMDLLKEGKVVKGTIDGTKPDVTLILDDESFVAMGAGKLNGQRAFMTGKLKIKGAMLKATKLDVVLKAASKAAAKGKSKL